MNREEIIKMARQAGATIDRTYMTSAFVLDDLKRFAALVAAAERNKLAQWMIQFGFATGHGDTMEQLLDALGTEIVEHIEIEVEAEREACAKVCEQMETYGDRVGGWLDHCAAAIRARKDNT